MTIDLFCLWVALVAAAARAVSDVLNAHEPCGPVRRPWDGESTHVDA